MNSEIEKNVEFRIHRYDSQQKRHYVSKYNVPVRKGMTLLEALTHIKDNLDETLAFRHSCRMGQCPASHFFRRKLTNRDLES